MISSAESALGVDLATCTGWAHVRERDSRGPNDPEYIVLSAGTLVLPSDRTRAEQLAWLHNAVTSLVDELHPDLVAFEETPPTWRDARVVALQQQMYGVFMAATAPYGLRLVAVTPTAWQREMLPAISGRRGMKPSTVRKLLKRYSIEQAFLRAGFRTESEDEADATCIAIDVLRQLPYWAAAREAERRRA